MEVGSVVIAATLDDLRDKPSEQRLSAFRALDHAGLPLYLGADDALFQVVVVSESDKNEETTAFLTMH